MDGSQVQTRASPYRTVIEAMFQLVDRRSQRVEFLLNPQQADLDAQWSRRNLVTKIRQHAGISSYVIARYTAKCLAEENRRCVIVSAEADATARLLARARFIIRNIKGGLKPSISTDNTRAIVFDKTGSSLWIGTAGSRNFGRGDTISDLHLSEAAFYTDPENTASGLFPAAELGEITVESTGNGRGNWFHRLALQAREGRGFKLFFYSWIGLPSCSFELSDQRAEGFLAGLDQELEEHELYHEHGVSLGQLAWRRERIQTDYSGDLLKFKENYPRTFDECFQSVGASFFRGVRFDAKQWSQESRNLSVLSGHPQDKWGYVAGADVSGGVGRDNSVLSVWCLDTREQVAEWVSADVQPDEFGHVCASVCHRFNDAYLNVERNNHGLTTLSTLVGEYPLDRLHRGTTSGAAPSQAVLSRLGSYGTYTSETTRGLLLGTAQKLLREEYTAHSDALKSELETFVENSSGKLEADSGCFDDRVFAACHALICVERAAIVTMQAVPQLQGTPEPDPFAFETIFRDQEKGSSRYGISDRFG